MRIKMTTYEAIKIGEKSYSIKATVDDEVLQFTVGVGESEDELPELVEHYVNFTKNPSVPVPTYAQKRAAEYPPMSDYLDAVVKGDQAQIDAYVAACLAVKAKYPKEQA